MRKMKSMNTIGGGIGVGSLVGENVMRGGRVTLVVLVLFVVLVEFVLFDCRYRNKSWFKSL